MKDLLCIIILVICGAFGYKYYNSYSIDKNMKPYIDKEISEKGIAKNE